MLKIVFHSLGQIVDKIVDIVEGVKGDDQLSLARLVDVELAG